ncbi:MAG: S8 family serine peptidase [Candidatus Thiodiazotropha sp. (ex. Lucinoma kazani)]
MRKITLGLIIAATGGVSQAIEPNDPLYESSINLGPNILPIYYQWGLPALNLESAWNLSRGHAYISIVDTGIDTDHPDLTGNFRPQFSNDFGSGITDDYDVDERDDNLVGIGHGTHIAGIIAATANNNIGTASICWNCSIMVGKITGNSDAHHTDIKARALKWAIDNGTQIINLSSGGTTHSYLGRDGWTCDDLFDFASSYNGTIFEGSPLAARIDYCEALAYAEEMDVVMVAASGNGVRTEINEIHFPASDPRTIAVGAIDITGNATPILANSIAVNYDGVDTTQVADDENPPETHTVQFNHGPEMDLVAPGFNILSTFYVDATWNDAYELDNPYFKPECADYIDITTPHTPSNPAGEHEENDYLGPRPGGDGYGPCSGTSMATPHISGLAGILRSINPLLKKDQIKAALVTHATINDPDDPNPTIPNNDYGYGMPDALLSVQDVLGSSDGVQLNNRLTPLFSLNTVTGQDSFYTTSPQMAMAAMYGAMQPQPSSGQVNWYSTGPATPGYNSFPKPGFWWTETPHASVYILTTHNDPLNEGREIVPLYRLSYQGAHGSNNLNVDHAYTTEQAGIDAYEDEYYKLDGIEGYIFSRNESQPTGTVKLYRKYNPTRDDHAIFPESQLSYMTSQGYTQNSGNEWIGYVYPNVDSDWDGVINGFETILGTNMYDNDSDDDGISDGIEVNNYPYGDPMDPNN